MDISTSSYLWTTAAVNASLVQPSPPGEVETWSVAYRGRNMLLGAVGVWLNVLTLVAVFRNNDLTLYFRCALASLVSTDLGLMATTFTSSLFHRPSDTTALAMIYIGYIFADCTALTVLVIALDRASAVYFPAWYKTISERRGKILLSVLTPWLLSVCLTAMSFETDIEGLPRFPVGLLKESGLLLQGVLLLVCALGALLAYLAVVLGIAHRSRRFVVHPSFLCSAATPGVTLSESQRNYRITINIAFLAVWFCIVYIPFSCYLLMLYLTDADQLAEFNSPRSIIVPALVLFSSLINPFLFFWRLNTFTSAFRFLRRVMRRRRSVQPQDAMEMASRVSRNSVDVGQTRRNPLSASRSTEDGTTAKWSSPEERQSRHVTITTISNGMLQSSELK